MKTMLRKFKINHIKKDTVDLVLSDGNGQSFRIPKFGQSFQLPSNLRLKFQPAKLDVTYIYGTDIVLAMHLNKVLIYHQSEDNFPEWKTFFEMYSNTDAEIELSIRHFDEQTGVLLWNLKHQEDDVFKFRELLLLSHYSNDDLPRLVSRLKIENSLIFAIKEAYQDLKHRQKNRKEILLNCFKEYANLPTDLPFFVEWCLEEMDILYKLYRQDKKRGITLANLQDSQIIAHTSKLIPISIEPEKISEFINSGKF